MLADYLDFVSKNLYAVRLYKVLVELSCAIVSSVFHVLIKALFCRLQKWFMLTDSTGLSLFTVKDLFFSEDKDAFLFTFSLLPFSYSKLALALCE